MNDILEKTMYVETIQNRTSSAPPATGPSTKKATSEVGENQPREQKLAMEVGQCLSDLFRATGDKPEVWELAIRSLAPRRPTQTRRAFRHFMSWDDDQRNQAMAALEGAIEWAKDGRGELLLDAIEELNLSPRLAHAIVACWPASDYDAIKAPYNRWRNAVNELVSKYHRLAFKLANQFHARVGGDEDWVSQAFLALIKAAEMYDASKAEFITFAYSWIQSELKKAYEYESEHKKLISSSLDTHNETRNPENVEEEVFVGLVPGPNQQFVAINQTKEVSAAIKALTERERVVIRRLFGLNAREEVITADEISRDLGVTVARIYQIKAQALTKMQRTAA